MNDDQEFTWTDDMDEISGFGGGYEACCRTMVRAGVLWLRERGADLDKWPDFRDEMSDMLDDASGRQSSGAQVGAAMSHATFIYKQGWSTCAAKMRERKAGKAA
jgi:hypothetical protein